MKNKFPLSKNKRQCIGPCYFPNTLVKHNNNQVIHQNVAFCPTVPYLDDNNNEKIYDLCFPPTHKKDINIQNKNNIMIPFSGISNYNFLEFYYDIKSFDDTIKYISENKKIPLYTKMRIINSSLNAYGEKITIIDNILVEFYIDYINKFWLHDIYHKIHKYIHINNKNILLGKPENNKLKINDDNIIRINFISDRFINQNEIFKFLIRFIKNNKNKLNNMEYIDYKIKDLLIKYIEEKIKITI
jgi:hypothetical protein